MPWSPKSVLSAHQAAFIPPFSNEDVRSLIRLLRSYMLAAHEIPSLKRSILSLLGSMFHMHPSRSEVASILATLLQNSPYQRQFSSRTALFLDELREVMNEDNQSPAPSDDD